MHILHSRVPRAVSRVGLGLTCCCSLVLAAASATQAASLGSHMASGPTTRTIPGEVIPVVNAGTAKRKGPHQSTSLRQINIGLDVHQSARLDARIRDASTPGTPDFHHYLTPAQYRAQYAPTDQEVTAVCSWATAQGLEVLHVSPDNLLVTVQGTDAQIEHALRLTLNDYTEGGRTFVSPDRDPTVPADLNVRWISGLSDYYTFRRLTTHARDLRPGGYFPSDFRTAYDVQGSGAGQTIGITTWGVPIDQSTLDTYATHTGSPRLVIGQSGADGLDIIPINTNRVDTAPYGDLETAMDVEVAHGMAPGSHVKLWLPTSDIGLEEAISDAANDPTVHVVTNSWGCSCGPTGNANMEASFQHAASVGTTFLFSSGDGGSTQTSYYPASSPYVVAVGGTSLTTTSSFGYGGETAWSGSGGACLSQMPQPAWQAGVTMATCSGRAVPDIAFEGEPYAGAYVYYYDHTLQTAVEWQVGGTSLSAPLLAGIVAVWNQDLAASNRPSVGFLAPLLYQLAGDATTYIHDFHDVTSGSNGYSAGPGWDEVTGWGSFDLGAIESNQPDLVITGATAATWNQPTIVSAQLTDHGATTAVANRTVTFAAGGAQCQATTDTSGAASCGLYYPNTQGSQYPAPGTTTLTASFAGDAAYLPVQASVPFTAGKVSTTVSIGSAPNPTTFGTAVTLAASVSSPAPYLGTPSGTVQFQIDGSDVGAPVAVSNGQASMSISTLGVKGSPHAVTATYSGDGTYTGSAGSLSGGQTITKTTAFFTTYHTSALPSVVGQLVTFTVKIWANVGTPTGTVEFKDNGSDLNGCAQVPVDTTTGFAVCRVTYTSPGSHRIIPVYSGDDNFVSRTLIGGTQNVTTAGTTTTLTSSSTPSILGQPVTLTAAIQVNAPGAGTPTGTVRFQLNGTDLAGCASQPIDASSGQATCTTGGLMVGTQSITAIYGGDANFQSSTSAAVGQIVAYKVQQIAVGSPSGKLTVAIELQDDTGTNVSSSSITVTALRIVNSSNQTVRTLNAPFSFLTKGPAGFVGAVYGYANGTGLPRGSYNLVYQAGSDPTSHSVSFTI